MMRISSIALWLCFTRSQESSGATKIPRRYTPPVQNKILSLLYDETIYSASTIINDETTIVAVNSFYKKVFEFLLSSGLRHKTISRRAQEYNLVDLEQRLYGEQANAEIGRSVSNNFDGRRMAVSGIKKSAIYVVQEGAWKEYKDLSNVIDTGRGSFSLTMSPDGNVVALGAPNNEKKGSSSGAVVVIEEIITETWEQIGSTLTGKEEDYFGNSVSMSHDGRIIMVGAYGGGYVKIFQYDAPMRDWILFKDMPGEAEHGFGYAVALSGEGDCAVIGAPFFERRKGYVRMYDVKSFGLVQAEFGIFEEDHFGYSVTVSLDGSRAGAGAWGGSYARVYRLDTTGWIQLGIDIQGNLDAFGASISMNQNGEVIAVGAPWDATYGTQSGCTKVYQYNDGAWSRIDDDIIKGTRVNDLCGSYLSLSGDGSRLAVGCPGKDGQDDKVYNSGNVEVYGIPGLITGDDDLGSTIGLSDYPSFAPSLDEDPNSGISNNPSFTPSIIGLSNNPSSTPSLTRSPTRTHNPTSTPPLTGSPTRIANPTSTTQVPTPGPSMGVPGGDNVIDTPTVSTTSDIEDIFVTGSLVGLFAVSGAILGVATLAAFGVGFGVVGGEWDWRGLFES